jgi:hypothetical protein
MLCGIENAGEGFRVNQSTLIRQPSALPAILHALFHK